MLQSASQSVMDFRQRFQPKILEIEHRSQHLCKRCINIQGRSLERELSMGKALSFQTKRMPKIKFCYAIENSEMESKRNVIRNASK